MLLNKIKNWISGRKLSLKAKLTVALSSIAVTLLISSIISVMEYIRMSTYVSDLIADNIKSINMAQTLSDLSNTYNLDILTVIGEEGTSGLPELKQEEFMAHCDSLRKGLGSNSLLPLTDSIVYSYSAYMLTTLELEDVILSDFIDTRTWYFERLQPKYNRLHRDIDALNAGVYNDLKKNSQTFERGFYRSIIPGMVAVMVGLLLIVMLLFFMLAYYVNPIYKMLRALDDYKSSNKKYTYTFDGDDQLAELNTDITDLTNENQQLRRRISALKNDLNKLSQ